MTPEELNHALAEKAGWTTEVDSFGDTLWKPPDADLTWDAEPPDFANSIDAQHHWIDPLVETKWRGPFREQTWFYEGKWHWQLWGWPELSASGEAIEWAAARAEALLAALQ